MTAGGDRGHAGRAGAAAWRWGLAWSRRRCPVRCCRRSLAWGMFPLLFAALLAAGAISRGSLAWLARGDSSAPTCWFSAPAARVGTRAAAAPRRAQPRLRARIPARHRARPCRSAPSDQAEVVAIGSSAGDRVGARGRGGGCRRTSAPVMRSMSRRRPKIASSRSSSTGLRTRVAARRHEAFDHALDPVAVGISRRAHRGAGAHRRYPRELLLLAMVAPFLLVAMALVWSRRCARLLSPAAVTRHGVRSHIVKLHTIRRDGEAGGAGWGRRATRHHARLHVCAARGSTSCRNRSTFCAATCRWSRAGRSGWDFVEPLTRDPLYAERHAVKAAHRLGADQLPVRRLARRRALEAGHDLYYIKNFSILFDVSIIAQTLRAVLWPSGVR